MKRIVIGLIGGIIGAVINIFFLLFAPNLEIEVYVATGITWIAIGILISLCNFKMNSILKGIWTMINALVVGAIIGYVVEKIISKTSN